MTHTRVEHRLRFENVSVAISEYSPRRGSRGALLFVHGRLGQALIWQPLIEELCPNFRCFAVDLPGFGQSQGPSSPALALKDCAVLLTEVLERLIPEGATLIGHDTGGAISQLCALGKASRVRALILINSACLMNDLREMPLTYGALLLRLKLWIMLRGSRGLNDSWKTLLYRPWCDVGSRASMLRSMEALFRSWPSALERSRFRQEFSAFPRPVLLLWGALDGVNPLERGFEMVRRLPDSQFFQNEDCGHWPSLEDPQWVASKMREFLFYATKQAA